MSRMVDDLLNLARVGRQELRRTPVDLGRVLEQVVSELKRDTQGRSIQWRVNPLPTVECDVGLIRLVFANLLSNAIKYTKSREQAVIEIGSQRINTDMIAFVRDNGAGFDMKYADKLFGVFQRLHDVEEFEGTGIGLATVERIVRRHGGSVWAEGEVDKGATFHFRLPRVF